MENDLRGVKLAILALSLFIGVSANSTPLKAQNSDGPWRVLCTDPASPTKSANPESCRMEQALRPKGEEEKLGNLLSLTVFYSGKEPRKPYMIMRLPLGVDLRKGMVLKVDNGQEMTSPYFQCRGSGCEVHLELNEKMLNSMIKGNQMKVGFLPFGSSKTIVVIASLKGFSKAFEQIR